MSATHGDCKNDNKGKHNGYDCPVAPDQDDNSTPPPEDTPPPVIWVS